MQSMCNLILKTYRLQSQDNDRNDVFEKVNNSVILYPLFDTISFDFRFF